MKRKIIIWTIVLAVVAGTGLWLWLKPSKGSKIYLQTEKAVPGKISISVMATGTLEPVTEVEVGTQVSGIIDKLYVDYNDIVKAGQLIAEMDKVTLQAELEQSEAELASSKTEYEYQEKNFARSKVLYEKELISDAEYDEALYSYEKALNAYNQSKASIVKVRRNLGYATITSPIDGVVISRAVEEGQTVAAGFETPTLFTIANDLTRMQVIADVDEADIGQVKDGQRVEFTVDAYPDDTFEGTVKQVRLEATTESSVVTYEVVITAYNPELKLKPGLTANVTIYTMEKENALTVPSKALRFIPDPILLEEMEIKVGSDAKCAAGRSDNMIWIKQGDSIMARKVITGVTTGSEIEITEGLSAGEEVVSGISIESAPVKTSTVERSPFMPSPPGGGNDRK